MLLSQHRYLFSLHKHFFSQPWSHLDPVLLANVSCRADQLTAVHTHRLQHKLHRLHGGVRQAEPNWQVLLDHLLEDLPDCGVDVGAWHIRFLHAGGHSRQEDGQLSICHTQQQSGGISININRISIGTQLCRLNT